MTLPWKWNRLRIGISPLLVPMVLVAGLGCTTGTTQRAARLPIPLPQAHAHNDYVHDRPLLDALKAGFCSVEADIFLVNGQLLVAHDREDLAPERTLRSLYLIPLQQRAREYGGKIYPGGPTFTLLIDIKSEAVPTYLALHETLRDFREMLTVFRKNSPAELGAVTVIVSGNRPRETMELQEERLAAMDGRLPDLSSNPAPTLIPLVSDNWRQHFTWDGQGDINSTERDALEAWVATAHQQGRRLRFWAVPDQRSAWRLLRDAGVDLVNTDDLTGLSEFLRKESESGR